MNKPHKPADRRQPKEIAGNPDNQRILDAIIISEQEASRIMKEVRRERDEEWE